MITGRSRHWQRAASAAISTLAILLAPAAVSATSPLPDTSVQLAGSKVAGLNQARRVADEDAGKIIDVQLALKLRNRAELDQLILRVSTPGSPEYGQYLSPAEFAARFGPTAAQVGQATSFLVAHGFQVTAAAPGSILVDARVTVAAVEAALQTSIGQFHDGAGHDFFANDTEPSLPASLASFVTGVQGLNNRYIRHHAAILPKACPPTCASPPYTPAQIRQAYKLSAAPLTSLTGTGQTLGLLELDDFWQANINGYTSAYGLPAITPARQVVDGGPGLGTGQIEVELDIEVMHAIAPASSIQVFEAPNTDTGLLDAYGCMVSPGGNATCPNHVSGLISASNSTSWGLCEPNQLGSTTNALASIFSQAALQGQSFFAASGDTGSDDCANSTLAVDSPASDPHITAAGGTRLLLNPDNSYNSETAWPPSPPTHPNWGSGGGTSGVYTRPAWQTGPGVITSGGAMRQVPDIALDADPVTGYSIYTCKSSPPPCTSGGGLRSIGGTSAAAPAWAAFTAIYNQYAASVAKPNLGFANPTLYQMGSCLQTFTPFNDITTGNNIAANPAGGYSAGPGYDMVTGLGTLRASDLAQDLAGPVGPPQLTTVAPGSGSANGGNTVILTGCGFVNKPTVSVGGVTLPGSSVQFLNSTTLHLTMPAHAAGTVQVSVANPTGPASNSLPYTYIQPPPPAVMNPLSPKRLADTRCPPGGPDPYGCQVLGPFSTLDIQVTGPNGSGQPPADATAAVLNVTAINYRGGGYLTLFPTGSNRPNASNLNLTPGLTIANLVEVSIGSGGMVSIYNDSGLTDVIVDVQGFVGPEGTPGSGRFHPGPPARIVDTRSQFGPFPSGVTSLGPFSTLDINVAGAGSETGGAPVPPTGAEAVVLNVTATGGTQDSYMTVYPANQSRPRASNLNFPAGRNVPNRVIVPLGGGGAGMAGHVEIYNNSGTTDVIVDVNGWFTDGSNPSATGGLYTGEAPVRTADSRAAFNVGGYARLSTYQSVSVQVAGRGGVPFNATSVVVNVTVVDPSAGGYYTIYPADVGQPLASDLNFVGGQTVPNLVVVQLSSTGAIEITNSSGGSDDFIVDVSGWYS